MTTKKQGDIFYRDRRELRENSLHALAIAKEQEHGQQKKLIRIDSRTVILVDEYKDTQKAVYRFKKRYKYFS